MALLTNPPPWSCFSKDLARRCLWTVRRFCVWVICRVQKQPIPLPHITYQPPLLPSGTAYRCSSLLYFSLRIQLKRTQVVSQWTIRAELTNPLQPLSLPPQPPPLTSGIADRSAVHLAAHKDSATSILRLFQCTNTTVRVIWRVHSQSLLPPPSLPPPVNTRLTPTGGCLVWVSSSSVWWGRVCVWCVYSASPQRSGGRGSRAAANVHPSQASAVLERRGFPLWRGPRAVFSHSASLLEISACVAVTARESFRRASHRGSDPQLVLREVSSVVVRTGGGVWLCSGEWPWRCVNNV